MTRVLAGEIITFDLPLTVAWATTVFIAAALGGAIVLWITRGVRAETDLARQRSEQAAERTIKAMEAEQETRERHIVALEQQIAEGKGERDRLAARVSELEGTIKVINDTVTARPAYNELTTYLTRGFDMVEQRAEMHEQRSAERHKLEMEALASLVARVEAIPERRRRSVA